MKIDLQELRNRADLISEQKHPDADLIIWNYNQNCQFSKAWDEYTKMARGLITDSAGNVIANPFPKFFNLGEHQESLPDEEPIITEKVDGSLGILYWIGNEPYIATRGSFSSEQALWATKWFRENVNYWQIPKSCTHLFEIIYPENRIVVNYDFSGLVLLAIRHTDTGEEVELHDTIFKSFSDKIRIAKRIQNTDLAMLQEMDAPNSEGFVVFYPKANLRIKLKFPEYVRLHKLITGVSEIAIWEHLRDGNSLDDLLQKVPDEFFQWVRSVENDLRAKFAKIWGEAQMAVQMAHGGLTRKEQALYIMENARSFSGIVFSLIDGQEKKAVAQAWKMVRPRGRSGFKQDIDA